jgi:hypothetical protein
LADRCLKIGHRQARGGAPINPFYQTELREIVVAHPDHDQPLSPLTNDFERPATDIAQLSKERLGDRPVVQVAQAEPQDPPLSRPQRKRRAYPDLCRADRVSVLRHQTAARSFKHSTALLLSRLKLGLFGPLSLREHATPLPDPQTCLAFQ